LAITEPGLYQLVLGAKDQRGGASNRVPHLAARRIERQRARRVGVGEAATTADELDVARFPGAGVGGILQERSERLGKLGYPVECLDRRPVPLELGTPASV
jgi:hypothetical protein